MEDLLKIQREGNDLVIRISVDDLKQVAENKPDAGYKILDKDVFLDKVIFQLQNISSYSGSGLTQLQEIFDNAVDSVYESAEDCIIDEGWDKDFRDED